MIRTLLTKWLAVFALSLASVAHASDPLNIVVPNPPGGGNDMLARFISAALEKEKISNIVVNKSGAQGTIGMRHALTLDSKNTIVVTSTGPSMYAPLLMEPAPYDIRTDFLPVAGLTRTHLAIMVPADSSIRTVKDLVTQLKTAKKPLRYGQGSMIHKVSVQMMLEKIGAQAMDIPFKGGLEPVVAAAGGHVDFAISDYADSKDLYDLGKVRIIGMLSDTRHHAEPSIPTFRESGVDFSNSGWQIVLAGKGMSAERISQLNRIINKAIREEKNNPYIAIRSTKLIVTPNELKNLLAEDFTKFGPAIRKFKE